ncbi:apolipoprotein N-acyltransferase [Xylophilus sp. GOD-11R]|uniref:apolipoprotein N-acyltransferase n=1 Tax=Xylophilus sp. GOD-11R TaxID=3089814 RepID=UPI00298C4071|nr:apolipoprotein N-acyltransferase [Xylophilus sp. GOD-11R]WPB59511.1 apolipoprotein N-acyltransferase [Xylophilus sp. GOD-11R]
MAAVLAGLAQAASIASPLDGAPLWWLQMLSLAALVLLLDAAPNVRSAGLRAWLFSIAWLCGTFWWLFTSMHTYGGLAAPLAMLAVLGLAAFLGLYYGVAGAVYRAMPQRGLWRRASAFGGLWLVAELLRGTWFTGFPWGAGGYAHVDGAAHWLAPLIGVYGLGALAAVLAAAAGLALRARRALPAGIAIAVSIVASLWPQGEPVAEASAPLSVALLQGNIPQDEKFQPGSGVPLALDWYLQQLQAAKESLLVAPETAIPVLPQDLPTGYADTVHRRFATGTQAALIGLPVGNNAQGYSNAAIGLRPDQASPYLYEKHHLVPFGEFVPPLFRWFTDLMNIPLGDFRRGDVGQPSFVWQGQRLAPNICYEDLFGEELARRFVDVASAPTIFVNLSNIGWFGNSIAIDQHLNISRMRSLEFERPMLRATNTGATVVIDDRGRVTASLEPFTRDVLHTEVRGRSTAPTLFARWAARWGNAPLWIVGLAVALAAGLTGRGRHPGI